MKKALSLFLALIILVFSTACSGSGNDKTKNDDTTKHSFDSIIEQEYNESIANFKTAEILTFTHSDGEYLQEYNSIFSMSDKSQGGVIPFGKSDYTETFSNVKAPFGFSLGEKTSEIEKKFSLETGYAAYVNKGGALQMYDSKKGIDIDDGQGGCMYFGYALNRMGDWAFMNYTMLTATMSGQLVISGATEAYNVVLYSCVFDEDLNVKQITVIYGEVSTVMQYIS